MPSSTVCGDILYALCVMIYYIEENEHERQNRVSLTNRLTKEGDAFFDRLLYSPRVHLCGEKGDREGR